MKKLMLLLISFSAILMAQHSDADTSVTRLKISDVKYYDVIMDNFGEQEDMVKSNKPFALIQPDDKWFSKDKWMHMTSAYFITLQSSYTLEKMLLVKPENSRNISIGISLGFSLGKEFYDVFDKKGIFSWKDLVYDVLGAGLGYLTAMAVQN